MPLRYATRYLQHSAAAARAMLFAALRLMPNNTECAPDQARGARQMSRRSAAARGASPVPRRYTQRVRRVCYAYILQPQIRMRAAAGAADSAAR